MYHNPSRSLDSWPAVIGFCGLAIGIQVVLGGVRPVGGSILAQFAKNGFNSQVTTFAEYLFDSPLKIFFLRTLGIQSPVLIALVFIALTFLPFAHWSVWSALAAAFLVSAITSDVSRVFFIPGFPVILFAIIKYGAAPSVRQLQVLLPVLALSSVVALLGWTGVEIFDWKGLANAMIKYGETSNIPKLFLQLRQPYE